MYEYLQALHQRFFRKPGHTDLHDENTKLQMIDVQGYLKIDVSLESYAAGFKLVSGIAKELEADGLYSYDEEVEEQMESSSR